MTKHGIISEGEIVKGCSEISKTQGNWWQNGEEELQKAGRIGKIGWRVKGNKNKGAEAETRSRREGGRAEDTAEWKPVICQISHGWAHIHIMPPK